MYDRFHLVLMVNHACNLRCTYCYTGHKFSRRISESVATQSIDRALQSIKPGGTLEIGFFGGEPLIEASLIEMLIDYAHSSAAKRRIGVQPGLTTNGMIVTAPAWRVMTRLDLVLAVSHDGVPRAHDLHRLAIDGQPTSGAVAVTIQRLIAHGKDLSVIMVVRPDTVDELPDGIEYLRRLGVRHIEPSLDLWTRWTGDDIQRLELAITRCARLWRQGLPVHSIGWFDEKAALLAQLPGNSTARCAYGDGQIAVAPSGRLYPCERLIGEDHPDNPAWLGRKVTDQENFFELIKPALRQHDECDQCPMNRICNTHCRCSNLVRSGDVRTPDELLCKWNQACLTATAEAVAAMGHEPAIT